MNGSSNLIKNHLLVPMFEIPSNEHKNLHYSDVLGKKLSKRVLSTIFPRSICDHHSESFSLYHTANILHVCKARIHHLVGGDMKQKDAQMWDTTGFRSLLTLALILTKLSYLLFSGVTLTKTRSMCSHRYTFPRGAHKAQEHAGSRWKLSNLAIPCALGKPSHTAR